MLRADNVICGTTTTGTGTLTLAACPTPPGGIDFDVFARATGIGFANGATILVTYTIIEYTSSSFATAKSHEKGIGTLTLGGSSGIANCTLARTTKQTSATSLNTQPATLNTIPATGISIVTAANTLVFIAASAADVMEGSPPYVETVLTDNGIGPLATASNQSAGTGHFGTTAVDHYMPFYWPTTLLVKKMKVHVGTGFTGTTNFYGTIYAPLTTGRPGKLLIDFGVLGVAGSSLNTPGVIASAAHANGFLLTPGAYIVRMMATFTGVTGQILGGTSMLTPFFFGADGGASLVNGMATITTTTATGGSAVAPDPANLTGYVQARPGGSDAIPGFTLTP